MYAAYEGVNMVAENKPEKFDMHCGLMGGSEYKRLNYYTSQCLERQKNPEQWMTCFPVCRLKDNSPGSKRQITEEKPREYKWISKWPMEEQIKFRNKLLAHHRNGMTYVDIAKTVKYNKKVVKIQIDIAKMEENDRETFAA